MKVKKLFAIFIISAAIYIFFASNNRYLPIEDLDIPAGTSIDVVEESLGRKEYLVASSVYNFRDGKSEANLILEGKSNTIAESREIRQLFAAHKYLSGSAKVYIFGEKASESGINDMIKLVFANPLAVDITNNVVCEGKALDILKFQVEGYSNSSEYIEGMVRTASNYNFFSNNYKLMDVYARVDSEGRNLVLPYIKIENNMLKISGMALFKSDKMVRKIDIKEAKVMNMLRENKVTGLITLNERNKAYVNFYAMSSRKVTCKKYGDKYTFHIDLKLTGDIVANTSFPNLANNPEDNEKLESEIDAVVKNMCDEFISKMKNEYKIDCLDLGRVAAAKYGRKTGVDWNEIVSKSEIKVTVESSIDRMGRGEF